MQQVSYCSSSPATNFWTIGNLRIKQYGTYVAELWIRILDTDPAFQVNPDPDLIRIQGFDDQKLKKKTTDLIKNCNLLMSKLQKKPFKLGNICRQY